MESIKVTEQMADIVYEMSELYFLIIMMQSHFVTFYEREAGKEFQYNLLFHLKKRYRLKLFIH